MCMCRRCRIYSFPEGSCDPFFRTQGGLDNLLAKTISAEFDTTFDPVAWVIRADKNHIENSDFRLGHFLCPFMP